MRKAAFNHGPYPDHDFARSVRDFHSPLRLRCQIGCDIAGEIAPDLQGFRARRIVIRKLGRFALATGISAVRYAKIIFGHFWCGRSGYETLLMENADALTL